MKLHPACAHLQPLLGKWRGEGSGDYPGIEPFTYSEEVTFGHVGKPFLSYSQRTRGADGLPLHAECGYWRPVPGVSEVERGVEVLIIQPSGIFELLTGALTLTHFGFVSTLSALKVIGAPTARRVDATERRVSVDGDVLRCEVSMAATGHPMSAHVEATLLRFA